VLDLKRWQVDEPATQALRERMRRDRGQDSPPFVTRGWPADFDGVDVRALEAAAR
jgi:hypothetical protein